MSDLTRWNRAGLSRFEYLDGNGAVFLERLRAGLEARFPQWRPVPGMNPLADEGEEAKKARLEALYQADPGDMLWQLLRQFARSCHVLGAHIDACANESYLETASQWENLRRLVALLDYAPLPPASASAPLALLVKTKTSGTVTAGLQIKGNLFIALIQRHILLIHKTGGDQVIFHPVLHDGARLGADLVFCSF